MSEPTLTASPVVEFLNAGLFHPYLSSPTHHLAESARRSEHSIGAYEFLCFLPVVISFRSSEGQAVLDSYDRLQIAEIFALLRDPSLTLDQVRELVKPIACSGCCSGKELFSANRSPLAFLA
jgi:hypothetical protein